MGNTSTASQAEAAPPAQGRPHLASSTWLQRLPEPRRTLVIILMVSLPLWLYAIVAAGATLAHYADEFSSVLKFAVSRLLMYPFLFGAYVLAMRTAARLPIRTVRFWLLQVLIAAVLMAIMYPLLLIANSWAFRVPVPAEDNFVMELLRGHLQNALAPFRLWQLWLETSLELSELYLLGLALILALSSFVRFRVEQDLAAELHSKWMEARLGSLRDQIGPHFLFNGLQAILGLIPDEPELAERMTIDLAGLLRHNLDRRDQEFTSVEDELQFVDRYLDIMKLRFGSRLQVQVEFDPAIFGYRMPSFLLLPLVENAVKHGVARIPGDNAIVLIGALKAEQLHFTVLNSAARQPDVAAERAHREVGLETTRQRIAHLFGPAAHFEFGPRAPGHWETRLVIPARKE